MARIRVPAGTVQKLEKVFDDLQTFVDNNQKKRLDIIFKESFGFALDVRNGVLQDNDFKVTLNVSTDTPTQFTVNSGQLLTSGNKYIKMVEPFVNIYIPSVEINAFYIVRIRYAETGSNLQTSMSSFLYDPQSGETTKYTRFNDAYVIDTKRVYEATGWRSGIGANDIGTTLATAIIKSDSGGQIKLVTSQFTFEDPVDGTLTSDANGVLDIRPKQRLKIDHDLLDDAQVFMKDRNSTALDGGSVTGNIDFEGSITVSGLLNNIDSPTLFSTNKGIQVLDPDIQAGTNVVQATGQLLRIGAPWITNNDIGNLHNVISLRRTQQDIGFSAPAHGFGTRGVWMEFQGSGERGTIAGNSTTEATSLYFKDAYITTGKVASTLQRQGMASIYALNKPNNHVPNDDGSDNAALALNLTSNTNGVVISKRGNMLIGGIYRTAASDGHSVGRFSLHGLDNYEGPKDIANLANMYLDTGIAIAAHGALFGGNYGHSKGIHWPIEGAQGSDGSGARPYSAASIAIQKDPSTTDDINYNANLRIQLNDNISGNDDATTKLRLTADGLLMLGTSTWLDAEDSDSLDINYWARTKGYKLAVKGGALFTDGRVQITDPSPGSQAIGNALSTSDPTFKVTGITSLSGDLFVTGNTRLEGNLDLPQQLTVTGIQTEDFELKSPFRPNIAWRMSAWNGETNTWGLTHAMGVDADGLSHFGLYKGSGAGVYQGGMSASGFAMYGEHANIDIGSEGQLTNFDSWSSNHLNIQGLKPAIYLRGHSNSEAKSNQLSTASDDRTDWYIGAGLGTIGHKILRIGAISNAPHISNAIRINQGGHITIGGGVNEQSALDATNFNVNEAASFNDQVDVVGTTILHGKLRFRKDGSDSVDPSAGVSNNGNLFLGTEAQDTGNPLDPTLVSKGRVHIFDDNTDANSRPMITFSSDKFALTSKILLDANDNLKAMNGSKALWQSQTDGEGIIFNNIECEGISGSHVHLSNSSYLAGCQAASMDVTGPTTINSLHTRNFARFDDNILASGMQNEELYLGVGSLGLGGRGLKVLTEKIVPTTSTNVRIHDVNPIMNGSSNYPFSSIHLKKNYSKIHGTGQTVGNIPYFKIDNSLSPIDTDPSELEGKHLNMQQSGGLVTYKIIEWDNTNKRMQLSKIDSTFFVGTTANYTGETAQAPGYAEVVDLGNKVHYSAVPVDSDGNPLNLATHEGAQDQSNDVYVGLPLGQHYIIRLSNTVDTLSSSYVTMGSGTYDPDSLVGSGQSVQDYGYPYYNQLPFLEDDGAISTSSSPFGFSIDITGWGTGADPHKTAREWEIGYSKGNVNFEHKGNILGTNTVFLTTENRHEEINIIDQDTYNVSVRPLQNGQVVGNPKTAVVTAGGGGAPADYVGYWFGEVNVLYNTGTFVDAGAGTIGGKDNGFVTWSGVAMTSSPFSDTQVGCSLAANEIASVGGGGGQQLEVLSSNGATSYGFGTIISHGAIEDGSSGSMSMKAVVGTLKPGYDTTGNKWVTGSSKDGRKIGEFSVTNDITIKVAVLEISWATGVTPSNPGVIRVYQKNQEAQAGTMNIGVSSGGLSQTMDVEIKGSVGARTIIVDAWDPDSSTPNNTCSINGTLKLYGQALTGEDIQITL